MTVNFHSWADGSFPSEPGRMPYLGKDRDQTFDQHD